MYWLTSSSPWPRSVILGSQCRWWKSVIHIDCSTGIVLNHLHHQSKHSPGNEFISNTYFYWMQLKGNQTNIFITETVKYLWYTGVDLIIQTGKVTLIIQRLPILKIDCLCINYFRHPENNPHLFVPITSNILKKFGLLPYLTFIENNVFKLLDTAKSHKFQGVWINRYEKIQSFSGCLN